MKILTALMALLLTAPAFAQTQYPTPAGPSVPVLQFPDTGNVAHPVSQANPMPVGGTVFGKPYVCGTLTAHGTLTPAGSTSSIAANPTRCELWLNPSPGATGTCTWAFGGSDAPSATVGHPIMPGGIVIHTAWSQTVVVFCPVGTTAYYEDTSSP